MSPQAMVNVSRCQATNQFIELQMNRLVSHNLRRLDTRKSRDQSQRGRHHRLLIARSRLFSMHIEGRSRIDVGVLGR
jgi:hypothetical protein